MTATDNRIAEIVAAYATRADVTADQITDLYTKLTHAADAPVAEAASTPAQAPLAEPAPQAEIPSAPAAEAEQKMKPAVPIADSVKKNEVTCLCCGKSFKMLKRHLGSEHDLTVPEYFKMFGLPENHPIVAPSYSKLKASGAKRSGFGKYSREEKPTTKGKSRAKADS